MGIFRLVLSGFTEQLVSEHVELLLVQAPVGDGGELPAENLGQLRPHRLRGVEEELQVLRMRSEGKKKKIINAKTHGCGSVISVGRLAVLWPDSAYTWQVKTFLPGAFGTAVFTPEIGVARGGKYHRGS